MKGGPSIEVLLDLVLGDEAIAREAAVVLKTQVFLYEADTDRLGKAFKGVIPLPKRLSKAMP